MDNIYDVVASPGTGRTLVLLVVLFPFLAALLVTAFGRSARRAALLLALVHLGLTTCVVALGAMRLTDPTPAAYGATRFQPFFVPGSGSGAETDSGRTTWTVLGMSAAPTAGRAGPEVRFFVGIDGLNLWLLALASFMMIPAVLASWESVRERPGAYFGWLFVLQGAAVGAFLSFDVILFYAFFELTLIPAFFLIGRWGEGSGRRDAARKFFLYTLAGSLLTLIGVIGIVLTNPDPLTGQVTFSLPDLMGNVQYYLTVAHQQALAGNPAKLAELQATQFWLFIALVAGFLVKVPVWPFHTWLPSAYGESPIGTTVLLSGLLSKLGTFGLMRFVLPLTPDAAVAYGLPVVGSLAAFGIVYAALCAYNQKDIKLVIAYSSVSHLGFLVLGILAFNAEGMSGAVLHMLNHGLTTGAMFALLGFLLDRYRTTQTHLYGGLMGRFPGYAFFVFVLSLASIGLPGLNNFVSEMLMLAGLFDARNPGVHRLGLPVVAAVGILLSAWYVLTMLQRVFFNPPREPEPVEPLATPPDVGRREVFAFGSLAALCLLLGLYPQPVLDSVRPAVNQLSNVGEAARARVLGVPVPAPRTTDLLELPPPPAAVGGPAPKGKGGNPKGKGKGGNPKGKGGNPKEKALGKDGE